MIEGANTMRIGVLGFGIMGAGIVQVAGVAGHPVTVLDTDDEAVARGQARLTASLAKGVDRGKVDPEAARALTERLVTVTDASEMADCDLVIEAVPERDDIKAESLSSISAAVRADAIIATNTSSISVTALSRHVSNPARFAGLHFFNPAQVMRLVEVIPGIDTSQDTVDTLKAWAVGVDKEPVVVKDQPGFLVNAVLMPYLNQAIRELDSGLASAEDIDEAVRLGLGYPKGPLELLDLIGLDTHLHATGAAFAETADVRYAPPPMLRRLVAAGRLGHKSGRGFRTEEGES